jgi:hypothetical protein
MDFVKPKEESNFSPVDTFQKDNLDCQRAVIFAWLPFQLF